MRHRNRTRHSSPIRHALAALGLATLTTACAARPAQPTIHTVTASPRGILVNAYLVETPHGVVAVDSALTVSDAKALRTKLDALRKPLLAVLVTHGHPDHYNGIQTLLEGRGDVPVYATEAVTNVIRESDAAKEAQWKPMFGEEWPTPRAFPTETARDGQSLTFDRLTWTVHALGPGESHADSYWKIDTEVPSVFLGDVVLHGEHAYVSDGHSGAWLATLDALERSFSADVRLYPGHGAAGGIELLAWQRQYLHAYRAEVDALRQGRDALTADEKDRLTARMTARYPEAGLGFLIGLGADAVAKELAEQDGNTP